MRGPRRRRRLDHELVVPSRALSSGRNKSTYPAVLGSRPAASPVMRCSVPRSHLGGIGLDLVMDGSTPDNELTRGAVSVGWFRSHDELAFGPAPTTALIRLFSLSARSMGVFHSRVFKCLMSKCSLPISSARHVGMTVSPSPTAKPTSK